MSAPTPTRRPSTRTVVLVGLAVCVLLAAGLSWFASSRPDGLEHVAESLGFAGTAGDHAAADSPLADYAARGVDGPLSSALAGIAGIALTGALMAGVLWFVRRGSDRRGSERS